MKTFLKNFTVITFVLLCCSCKSETAKTVKAPENTVISKSKKKQSYPDILEELESFRLKKAIELENETNGSKNKIIYDCCRDTLFSIMKNKIFPAWYGTKWSFSGHTSKPRRGHIACGYFVTRILDQMNFDIKMYKIAQQPPAYLVVNLSGKMNTFFLEDDEDVSVVKNKIKSMGKGIYVVGLECHVGFITYDGNNYFRFVHSSYYDPPLAVVSEKLESVNPLADSEIRVIGKLFDDNMLIKWLQADKFAVKYPFKSSGEWWDILDEI